MDLRLLPTLLMLVAAGLAAVPSASADALCTPDVFSDGACVDHDDDGDPCIVTWGEVYARECVEDVCEPVPDGTQYCVGPGEGDIVCVTSGDDPYADPLTVCANTHCVHYWVEGELHYFCRHPFILPDPMDLVPDRLRP